MSAASIQTTQFSDYRCLILKGDRDDGKHLVVAAGDEVLVEFDEIPEAPESHWQIRQSPAGLFCIFDDYIADGSWRKNGTRRPERVGVAAERRLILVVADGGPEFGTLELDSPAGAHFTVSFEFQGRVQAHPPTAEELLARFVAEHPGAAPRFRYRAGKVLARWSGDTGSDRQREASAGSFTEAVAGMIFKERQLAAWRPLGG